MRSPEFITKLRPISQESALAFGLLARHLYEMRLWNGERPLDALTFKELLEELSAEAKKR